MTKKAFARIIAGIEDAEAYAKVDKSRGAEHVVTVPEDVDVRAIRARSGLSRSQVASRFGLDVRAVQDWEQRRRRPDRATRVLLRVIDRDPDAVIRALGGK